MSWRPFLVLLLVSVMTWTGGSSPRKRSLAFVIDTTSSMGPDIKQIVMGIQNMIEKNWDEVLKVFANFIVSPFNDPKTGPVTNTSDPGRLVHEVQILKAKGGDDCPEMILTGAMAAVKFALPNSLFLIFTDGLAKDKKIEGALVAAFQRKGIVPVVVMTGCCHLNPCPTAVYQRISNSRNGAFYQIAKENVHYVMEGIIAAIVKDTTKLDHPPKNFNDLLLLISSEQKERRAKAIDSVATKECRLRKARKITGLEEFLIGCNRVQCTSKGAKVLEERCDADPPNQDCRSVSTSWRCKRKDVNATCFCLRDNEGVLVKVL